MRTERGEGERATRHHREVKGATDAAVEDALVARIVVDVDGDAAQGGDLGGELVEARVVLPVREGAVSAIDARKEKVLGDGCTSLARRLRTLLLKW